MRKYILLMLLLVALSITVVACSTTPISNTGTPGSQASGNIVSDVSGSPTNNPNPVDASGANTAVTPTGNTGSSGTSTSGTESTATTSSGDVKVINIVARRFAFDVTGPEIHVGDKVKLVVSSTDGTHGFAMPAYNVDMGTLVPGDTPKEFEFTADQAGTFDYFCNIPCGPGHSSMRGQLVVLP